MTQIEITPDAAPRQDVISGTISSAGSYTPQPFGFGRRTVEDALIQAEIDKALSRLPDGAKGAVVAHATGDGARLSAVGRIGDQWSIVAEAYKPYKGKLEYGASVRFTW